MRGSGRRSSRSSSSRPAVVATAARPAAAAVVLALGLALGGVAVPLLAARLSRSRAGGRRSREASSPAELAEILRGAPELAAYGREDERSLGSRARDAELADSAGVMPSSPALADAALVLVAGLTTVGVLALAVAAHGPGRSIACSWRRWRCSRSSSFDAVAPLPAAARELRRRSRRARACSSSPSRMPAIKDPPTPAPARERAGRRRARGRDRTLRRRAARARRRSTSPSSPAQRVALVGPSGAGKTTVTNLFLRFLDPERGRVVIGGRDVRELRLEDVRRTFALAGQEAHVFASSIRENLKLGRPDAPTTSSSTPCGARGSPTGSSRFRRGWTRSWGRKEGGFPAVSGSGSSSHGPFSRMRRCSSSTSRRRTSTPKRRRRSSRTYSAPPATAPSS